MMPLWLLALGLLAAAGGVQHSDGVTVHASTQFVRWTHPDGTYAIELPADWQPHAHPTRTNLGSTDGLVKSERGFRTVYGVIITIVDDPASGASMPSLAASGRALVDTVLKRNAHLSIQAALAEDRPLAGSPAYRAVLGGTSPVTGHAERAEVIVRAYDASRLLNVIFACPAAQCHALEPTFKHMRDSLQVRAVSK